MRLLFFLLALAAPLALAQTCQAELQAELSADQLTLPATGLQAAELLERAVKLLEPALPQLQTAESLPLLPQDEGYDTARYLAERGLLPFDWQPESLSADIWEEMLASVWAWYSVPPQLSAGDLTVSGLILDLSSLIAAVGPKLEPVALIASDPDERERIAFWAVIRNHSVYPRLVVLRPPAPEVTLEAGAASVLPLLSSCAQTISNYVYAPADTAERLFLANNRARMYLVAAEPGEQPGLRLVPEGEEAAYLGFDSSALAGIDAYAAVFDGPRVSPATLLRLVTQVRTNMNPRELVRLLSPN